MSYYEKYELGITLKQIKILVCELLSCRVPEFYLILSKALELLTAESEMESETGLCLQFRVQHIAISVIC